MSRSLAAGGQGEAASPGGSDLSRNCPGSAASSQHSGSLESISEWFPAMVPILFCLNSSSKTISVVIVLRFRKLALPETRKHRYWLGSHPLSL